jgi:hypothetical protein
MNFVCFCAHTAMIFVTLRMAYWRHGLNAFRDTAHVEIPIYRIRNVPTKFMLDNNMSQWSPGWNLTSSDPNSGLFLYDNGMPVRADAPHHQPRTRAHALTPPFARAQINFASLIIAFFATSAVAHFWALVAGAYER